MKICFCTSIFSRDDNLPDTPGHFERLEEYDYYCFTNMDESKFDTSWDIIKLNPETDIGNFKRIITVSRYPKFMAWEYFKKNNINYDIIFYCDGYFTPRSDSNWELISNFILKSPIGLIQSTHFLEDFCPYNELFRIFVNKKDTRINVRNTDLFFKRKKLPRFSGLYQNGCIGYSPKNINCISLLNTFWNFYSREELTWRDQPLWAYVLHDLKIKPIIFEDIFNEMNYDLMIKLVPNLKIILKTINDGAQHNHIVPIKGKFPMIKLLFTEHKSQIGFNDHRYLK